MDDTAPSDADAPTHDREDFKPSALATALLRIGEMRTDLVVQVQDATKSWEELVKAFAARNSVLGEADKHIIAHAVLRFWPQEKGKPEIVDWLFHNGWLRRDDLLELYKGLIARSCLQRGQPLGMFGTMSLLKKD